MFRHFAFNFLDTIIGVLYYGSTGSAIELRPLLVIIHNVNLLRAEKKNVYCSGKNLGCVLLYITQATHKIQSWAKMS